MSKCLDCGVSSFQMVMLKDDVWDSIANKRDVLCFSCIEDRLGRGLTWGDLSNAPINDCFYFGAHIENNASYTGNLKSEILDRDKSQSSSKYNQLKEAFYCKTYDYIVCHPGEKELNKKIIINKIFFDEDVVRFPFPKASNCVYMLNKNIEINDINDLYLVKDKSDIIIDVMHNLNVEAEDELIKKFKDILFMKDKVLHIYLVSNRDGSNIIAYYE